jgi:hypothetical protein
VPESLEKPKNYLFHLTNTFESEEKLIEAARESIRKNGCDSVIANDLNSLKSGNHEVIAVFPDHIIKYQSDQKTCAITDQLQNLEKERSIRREVSR